MSTQAQNRIFALIRVPFTTSCNKNPLNTAETSRRGGSGDAGAAGAPVHVHSGTARRAKQVMPESQIPTRLIGASDRRSG